MMMAKKKKRSPNKMLFVPKGATPVTKNLTNNIGYWLLAMIVKR